MGKGKIARYEQFLLFPQCFQLNQTTLSPFVHIFDITSLFAVELIEPKIDILGKELIQFNHLLYMSYMVQTELPRLQPKPDREDLKVL